MTDRDRERGSSLLDLIRPGQRRDSYPPGTLRALAFLLAVSLLTSLVLAIQLREERSKTAALRDRGTEQVGGGEVPAAVARDALAPIITAVEEIRGLTFREPVEIEVLSASQLAERVREALLDETDPDEFEASRRVLVALGLVDDDLDLWEMILAVQEEQIAGFYDTETKSLVIQSADPEDLSPLDEAILAHELTHALTDQHFGLGRLDDLREGRRDDQALAFLALVEGDAQLVTQLYVAEALTSEQRDELFREASGIDTELLDELPEFLQEVLEFPYSVGVRFVQALHRQGGFEAVDAAYRDPPVSTEQILHPQRYTDARLDPLPVRMPNVRPQLGGGWQRLDAGEIGELDLLLIGDHGAQSFSRAEARVAADGWAGGRYIAYASGRSVVVVVHVRYRSPDAAADAARLFGGWLPLRFRNVGGSFDAGPGNTGWEGRDASGAVVRSGDRMTLVIGPDRATVERALRAF